MNPYMTIDRSNIKRRQEKKRWQSVSVVRVGLRYADRNDCAGCKGSTLVELLVTVTILIFVAIALSAAISNILSIEQPYMAEAGVRTKMALQMKYAERYLSLANRVSSMGGTNTIAFRQETGGVSFETGTWIRVKEVQMTPTSQSLVFVIASDDEQHDAIATNAIDADGLVWPFAATNTVATLEGSGAIRKLTLASTFAIETDAGVEYRSITNSRPVRLWNYQD
jgi:Tfp pilus assembly protein PilE